MASCTAWTRLPGVLVATPSSAAARATATAVVAEEARRFSTAGSSEAPGAPTSAWPATASAGREQHAVGHLGRAGHDRAEAQAGVEQGVVGLPEGVPHAVVVQGRDRQA